MGEVSCTGAWLKDTVDFFGQYGTIGLFVLSFVEASFFPVPPYLLSIPMTLARPRLGLFYAGIGIIGSVMGGLLGYAIGVRLGRPVLARLLTPKAMAGLEKRFSGYGGWVVAAGGLTPVPFKVFTIASGVFRLPLAAFLASSMIARGVRWVAEALLLMHYGRPVVRLLEHTLKPLDLAILAALVLIAAVLWHSRAFRQKLLPAAKSAWRGLTGDNRLRRLATRIGGFGWYLITGATLTAFGSTVFAKLADDVLEKELTGFDNAVGGWIDSLRTGWLTTAMRAITNTGYALALILAVLAVLSLRPLIERRRLDAIVLGICTLGAIGLSRTLKLSFHRPRPAFPWLAPASGYSFPSGHALLTLSVFGFLIYLSLLYLRRSWQPALAASVLMSLTIIVGVSRIYLGVHYPTDILGGWLAAATWVGACIMAREYLSSKPGFWTRAPKSPEADAL